MVWYGMVWYGMVWYGMVWYKTGASGSNGVSTSGVTANFMFFDGGTFWVLALTCLSNATCLTQVFFKGRE